MDDEKPRSDHLRKNLSSWFAFVDNTPDAGRQLQFYEEEFAHPYLSFPKFILEAPDDLKAEFDAEYLAWRLLRVS